MKKINGIMLIMIMFLSILPVVTVAVAVPGELHIMGKPAGVGKPGPSGQVTDWGYARIGADIARASISAGTKIHVAVLDTGVDYSHPDLAGVVTWCYSAIKQTEGCDRNSADDDGHGTHVAGTIAALDNDIDSVGAAAGFVEIYNIKVLGKRGGDWYDLADAIRYATDGPDHTPGTADDADVISMSLGGDLTGATDIINYLQAAIDYADSYGVIIVAAAGNEGTCDPGDTQSSWPAMNNHVIAVGATGIVDSSGNWVTTWTGAESDAMPCFSNVLPNNMVDVSAPGVYITSLKKGGGTTEMSGTSMATPYTSAVIALMLANGWSYSAVLSRLQSTAIDMGYDASLQGAGLINAAAAV